MEQTFKFTWTCLFRVASRLANMMTFQDLKAAWKSSGTAKSSFSHSITP